MKVNQSVLGAGRSNFFWWPLNIKTSHLLDQYLLVQCLHSLHLILNFVCQVSMTVILFLYKLHPEEF